MKKINLTLINKLFISPNPPLYSKALPDLYQSILQRAFPGKDNFISFLRSDNSDEQFEFAEKAIDRLCYESNFCPPSEVMYDLITAEQAAKNFTTVSSKYIPRDHYIHTVYLYMLGIYLFFYNRSLYCLLTDEFKFNRYSAPYENDEISSVKDFISSWKYFCIYHDIGYQCELLTSENFASGIGSVPNGVFNYSLDESCGKTRFCSMLTAKMIARALMVNFIIGDNPRIVSENDKLIKRFTYESIYITQDESNDWKMIGNSELVKKLMKLELIYIKQVRTNAALKTFLSVLGENEISIWGTNSKTGKLSFIMFSEEGKKVFVKIGKQPQCDELTRIVENKSVLLFDDYESTNYNIEYYVKKSAMERTILASIDEQFQMIEYVKDEVIEKVNDFDHIRTDAEFFEAEYRIYSCIYKFIISMTKHKIISDQLAILNSQIGEQYSTSMDNCYNSIFATIIESYKDELEDSSLDVVNSIIKDEYKLARVTFDPALKIDDIIYNYALSYDGAIKRMATKATRDKLRTKIIQTMTANYLDKITKRTQLWQFNAKAYLYVQKLLSGYLSKYSVDYSCSKIAKCPNGIDEIVHDILIEWAGSEAKLTDIESKYEVPYRNKCDHGIESAYYFFNTMEMYKHIIKNAGDSEFKYVSAILNATLDKTTVSIRYIDNYAHIYENVLFAIFVHNLYPTNFSSPELKKLRVSSKQPFAYFAMIADALQRWNRPHSQHPSTLSKVPNDDAEEDFDISAEGDYVYVYESRDKEAQRKLNKSIEELSDYLRAPELYIRNGYSR